MLAGSNQNEPAIIWDVPSGKRLRKLKELGGRPTALDPTGKVMAVLHYAWGKDQIGFFDVAKGRWYRFADQPAMLNADLTGAERETLQKRVELLHRNWTRSGSICRRRRSANSPTSIRR